MNKTNGNPTLTVANETHPVPDIVETLMNEIGNDDGNTLDVSRELIEHYIKADFPERVTMDAILIILCGWDMGNLIGESGNEALATLVDPYHKPEAENHESS